MEQLLSLNYHENGIKFPKRKVGVSFALVVCLCILLGYSQSLENYIADTGSHSIQSVASEEGKSIDNTFNFSFSEAKEFSELKVSIPESTNIEKADMKMAGMVSKLPAESSDKSEIISVTKKDNAVATDKPVVKDEIINESENTVPVSATIQFYGNGGIPDSSLLTYDYGAVSKEGWPVPFRYGKIFDGWYVDPECTIPCPESLNGCEELNLYAGWKDFDYFMCDDRGYITSCTGSDAVRDGIIVLPSDNACTGITAHAFDGLEEMITDIYIPANIVYIEKSAFDNLSNLMYFEVDADNPEFYSEGGILYASSGEMLAWPVWYTVTE